MRMNVPFSPLDLFLLSTGTYPLAIPCAGVLPCFAARRLLTLIACTVLTTRG
jgi:hypothetical protein